jgi:fructose-1,6-bisphosphatase/inositol monophosphatase family enzyme
LGFLILYNFIVVTIERFLKLFLVEFHWKMRGNEAFRSETLDFFIEHAPKMGDIAMRHFRNLGEGDIRLKHGRENEPVTVADLEIRDLIVPEIRRVYGDSVIRLTEESVGAFGYSRDELMRSGKPIFTIDEIDGTKRFSEGSEDFSILLGCAERFPEGYEMTVSLVYHPPTEEFYFATRDNDAIHRTMEGFETILKVSDRGIMTTGVSPVNVAIGRDTWPVDYPQEYCDVAEVMERFGKANSEQVERHSKFSCGLEVIEIAKGNVDAFLVANAANWDYQPSLILQQADGRTYLAKSGGMLTEAHPWRLQLDSPAGYYPVLFTNGAIDESLFRNIRQYIE